MKHQQKRLSVLIVEDDSVSRTALNWLLADLGFDPIAVGTLAEARKALALTNPNIVILDLMLPDGDGTSLLASIRNARLPIKVAVVSAVTDQLRLHEITALGPDALFGKPLDLDDFDDWLVKQLSDFSLSVRDGIAVPSGQSRNRPVESLVGA
jgi:two-component system response regulator QseB